MATTEGKKKEDDTDGVQRRGILKHRSEDKHHSGVQWDEMNILQTYHPPDKEYGHMKINEPPTPYSKFKDPDEEGEEGTAAPISDDESEGVDPDNLTQKIKGTPRRKSWEDKQDDEEEEDDEDLTEEEKEKRKEFKKHRKQHYNEFAYVKKARELIEQELKELDKDDDDAGASSDKPMDHS